MPWAHLPLGLAQLCSWTFGHCSWSVPSALRRPTIVWSGAGFATCPKVRSRTRVSPTPRQNISSARWAGSPTISLVPFTHSCSWPSFPVAGLRGPLYCPPYSSALAPSSCHFSSCTPRSDSASAHPERPIQRRPGSEASWRTAPSGLAYMYVRLA